MARRCCTLIERAALAGRLMIGSEKVVRAGWLRRLQQKRVAVLQTVERPASLPRVRFQEEAENPRTQPVPPSAAGSEIQQPRPVCAGCL